MRILIVDDHALVRSGIASLLSANDIDVVGEANSGAEAIEKTRHLQPDIVLMDVRMPGCNGLHATQLIKTEMPDTRIVMVTAFDDDEALLEAMKNGAAGYVLKNVKAEDFVTLLSRVMEGEVVVSPWVASRIVEELRKPEKLRTRKRTDADLTRREEEVLKLVASGATNKEISSVLHISDNTTKFHLRNIMQKLQLKNRAQMAVYGARKEIGPS